MLGHISSWGLKELEKRKSLSDRLVNVKTFYDQYKFSNVKKMSFSLARHKGDIILEYVRPYLHELVEISSMGVLEIFFLLLMITQANFMCIYWKLEMKL